MNGWMDHKQFSRWTFEPASLKKLILQTFDEALKEHNGSVAANNEAKTPQ